MGTVLREVRYALRRLRRSPAFSAAALLTLGLGIGANVLIFGVVSTLFLRPLAWRDPDRLVWPTEFFPKFNRSMVLAPEYAAWKRESRAFDAMEAMGITLGANLAASNQPAQRVQLARVTPGFFRMTGVPPRIGAGFDPVAPLTAIVSDALWRGYLHSDPGIIGKSLVLNGKAVTVAGVMPPGFLYPDGADVEVWTPDAVSPNAITPGRSPQPVRLIGRLKPGVTLAQARADLNRIAREMDSQYPVPWSGYHAATEVRVISLQKQLTADSQTATAVLMGAVGFFLLIACANVANLFLARSMARRREIAMRTAIGAARRDIVRMLLAESLLLGAMGGVISIACLFWGRRAVMFLVPRALTEGIPIDWRVLAFAACCSIATGLLFGLMPAWAASREDVNSGLKETAISQGGRLPAILTAAQIALATVLLAGAGLMIRSFTILASTDPGFSSDNVLMATAMLRPGDVYGPERQVEYSARMLARISALPGVRLAAVTSSPPMAQFSELESGLRADDGPSTSETVAPASVSPDYFRVLRIPLVSGRFFDTRDGRDGHPAVIINQTLARILFKGRDPIGHRIQSATVVGVVADIRHRALDDNAWPEIFLPFEQSPAPWITILVRANSDATPLAIPVRQAAQAIDASQPLFDVDLLSRRVSESLTERRQRATVLGAFAGLALLIAVVGIYAVMSCAVARRTREIGLRMALGAEKSDLLRAVMWSGLRIAVTSMVIGLGGALLLTRVLRTFLYGVEPTDPATFCMVGAILTAAALCASYLPARRAAVVDPMTVLRSE